MSRLGAKLQWSSKTTKLYSHNTSTLEQTWFKRSGWFHQWCCSPHRVKREKASVPGTCEHSSLIYCFPIAQDGSSPGVCGSQLTLLARLRPSKIGTPCRRCFLRSRVVGTLYKSSNLKDISAWYSNNNMHDQMTRGGIYIVHDSIVTQLHTWLYFTHRINWFQIGFKLAYSTSEYPIPLIHAMHVKRTSLLYVKECLMKLHVCDCKTITFDETNLPWNLDRRLS